MSLWGRWGGSSLFLHADSYWIESRTLTCFPSSVTQLTNSTAVQYFTYFSLFVFYSFCPRLSLFPFFISLPFPTSFFSFPSHSEHREWCFGSHVTFCLSTIAGVCHWPIFLWKSVGFPGDGEWRHHFSAAAPLPSALLWASLFLSLSLSLSLSLFLSLPQAVVDQVAHKHDTQTVTGLCSSSSSSPSSPFSSGRQSQRPLDNRRWVKQMALFVEI